RYQEAGYHEAQVTLDLEASAAEKRVAFTIDEGLRFEVAPVDFEGRVQVPLAAVRGAILTGPPSWVPWRRGTFLQDEFDDDLKRVWYLYRRYGFLEAQIADYRIRADHDDHK